MRILLPLSLLVVAVGAGCVTQKSLAPPVTGPELTDRTAGLRAPYDPSPNSSFQRTDGADPFAVSPTEQFRSSPSYGANRSSRAVATTFQRANGGTPAASATLYYSDEDNTAALNGSRAVAGAEDAARVTVGGGFVSLNVRAAFQSKLPLVPLQGRTYVLGKKGQRYSLSLHNGSKQAVEVVLAVDGLDAIDLRPASIRKRGYVIDPGETAALDGFRTSRSAVTPFRFGAAPTSATEYRNPNGPGTGMISMTVYEGVAGGVLPSR